MSRYDYIYFVNEAGQMKKLIFLFIIAFLIFPDILIADKAIYRAPESIFLNIEPVSDVEAKETIMMKAEIKALTGNPTDFVITFFASPDIEVEARKITLKRLAHGDSKEFFIRLKKSSEKPNDKFSWVKMKVEFLPDYNALIIAVKKNEKEYSHPDLRDSLIRILFSEKEKSHKTIHVVGHAFLSGLNFKK